MLTDGTWVSNWVHTTGGLAAVMDKGDPELLTLLSRVYLDKRIASSPDNLTIPSITLIFVIRKLATSNKAIMLSLAVFSSQGVAFIPVADTSLSNWM